MTKIHKCVYKYITATQVTRCYELMTVLYSLQCFQCVKGFDKSETVIGVEMSYQNQVICFIKYYSEIVNHEGTTILKKTEIAMLNERLM